MRAGGQVHETEIDGVPTFWVDAPGTSFGCLTFRVGHADEALHRRGVTHLVEHLSLGACDGMAAAYNGSVGPTLTSLVAGGSPDEVADVLTVAARSLARLPFDRLETEARILRAEAVNHGIGLVGHALATRYGARDYGLAGFPELGVHHLDASSIDRWRLEWFTRQNAVLWLAGEPSADLDLSSLPDGRRRPPPTPVPLAEQPFPCWFGGPPGTMLVLAHLERSAAANAAWSIAGARLRKRLRNDEGWSYETSANYDRVTAHDAHCILVTDCIPDHAEAARDALVAEINRLATAGPTDDELADHVDRTRRSLEDPEQAPGHAQRFAVGTLLGEDVDDDPTPLVEALTVDQVAGALGPALRDAVWVVPDHVGMYDRRIHLAMETSPGSIPEAPGVGRPAAVATHHPDRLVVDAEQIALCWPSGRFFRIPWSEVAAVQHWTDDGRTVWGADGFVISIRPGEWLEEPRVIGAIDHHIGPDLVVVMPEPIGPAELDPPAPDQADPAGASRTASASTGVWGHVQGAAALVTDAVLVVVTGIAALFAVALALAPPDGWSTAGAVVSVGLATVIAAVFGSTFWRRRVAPDLARRAQARADAVNPPERPQPSAASGAGPIPLAPAPQQRHSVLAVSAGMAGAGVVVAAIAIVVGADPAIVARFGVVYLAGIIAASRR